MTRPGYLLLIATLTVAALSGAYLLAPSPDSLFVEEIDCADWYTNPRPGRFRLLDCRVDASFPVYHHVGSSVEDVLVPVSPASWDPPPPASLERPRLALFSDAPELRGPATRMHAFGDDEERQVRHADRHRARLVVVRDLEGRIDPASGLAAELVALDETLAPDVLVLEQTEDGAELVRFGALLLLLGLLGLIAAALKQRKWTRSRERLSGQSRPVQF